MACRRSHAAWITALPTRRSPPARSTSWISIRPTPRSSATASRSSRMTAATFPPTRQSCCIGAMQQDCLVGGKVAAVIREDRNAVALDLGVGRVKIHDVDLAGGECLVGKAVIQAAWLLRQAIRRLQARPAVAPAEELVRKAEAQSGTARELGNRVQRRIAPRAQRVAVAEAQRQRSGKTQRGEPAIDFAELQPVFGAQDFIGDRAGVFRIDIDGVVLERGNEDRRIAEPRLVLAACRLREDLAEDVRLREPLRADADRLLRVDGTGGHEQKKGAYAARSHLPPVVRNCSRARLAYKPSWRTSSACVPCATIAPRSMTTMRSACCTVARRCAMASVVRPLSSAASACCTMRSLAASSELVASSSSNIGRSVSRARAMDSRCRWPPDSVTPRSPSAVSIPWGRRSMNSSAKALAHAAMASSRLASGRP